MTGDVAGTPFGADAFAGQAEHDVLDGAGAGAVVFATAEFVFGDDLADGEDFGRVVEFGADFLLSFLLFFVGRGLAAGFERDGKFGDCVACAWAHDCETPGVGEFVVGGADGGFERALESAFGERGGEVIVNCAAVYDCLMEVH